MAAQICAKLKGIIISADSVQAYKGVQIGANKPSEQERRETPHILVDVADHKDSYNAAEWRNDTITAIQSLQLCDPDEMAGYDREENPREAAVLAEIEKARKLKGYKDDDAILPVVCGGTMMYLQWLVHGQPDVMRPSEDAIREATSIIASYQEVRNYQGAVEFVGSFGKVYTDRIAKFSGEDWYRLRRTLEVALTAKEKGNTDELIEQLYSGQREGSLSSFGYDVRCFFLCPNDRMNHTRIIDERCEHMVARGLLKETADLSLSGNLPEMATKAIGYRQVLQYFDTQQAPSRDQEEETFVGFLNNFTTATRRYAKKQMSWFRKDADFMFVPVEIDTPKSKRVENLASDIIKFCQMSREAYEKELKSLESTSAFCKKTNEEQGKGMKFYQFQQYLLKPGSEEFRTALSEALECRERMQAKRRRVEG